MYRITWALTVTMRNKKTMSEKQQQAVSENGVAVQSQETTYKITADR